MNAANPGSCVFFFTDADAKDEDRIHEVIRLANSKKMRLVYFLRGECSSRRRRSPFTVPENVKCIPNEVTKRAGNSIGYKKIFADHCCLFFGTEMCKNHSVVHV